MKFKQVANGDYYLDKRHASTKAGVSENIFVAKPYITVNRLSLPKELWGKRVRIKLEVVDDSTD